MLRAAGHAARRGAKIRSAGLEAATPLSARVGTSGEPRLWFRGFALRASLPPRPCAPAHACMQPGLIPGIARGMSSEARTAEDWNPASAVKMIVEEGAVVLDVRSEGEFAGGALPMAVHVDYFAIPERADEIEEMTKKSKEAPIVVYCRSGSRSGVAKQMLAELGYTYVANLGGIAEAQQAMDLLDEQAAK